MDVAPWLVIIAGKIEEHAASVDGRYTARIGHHAELFEM